jgi:hypothetical protein
MPITVKHTKVSTIPDDADTTLVRPSDWNADHTLVGLGTMAEQNANAVAITGGTATLTSVTTPIVQATNSAGLALRNSGGTTQISMGAGGGDNFTVAVSTNLNGTNAQIDISPTGTGHVHIKPTGVNSVEIAPVSVGKMDNVTIGVITPAAGTFSLISSTRINPRVTNITSSSTITPPSDTVDQYSVTALAVPATIAIPSGTAVAGQKLTLRLKDDGTARALTWTTSAGGYRVIGSTLPTTTVASKVVYIGCIYNSTESFWDVVAVAQQV